MNNLIGIEKYHLIKTTKICTTAIVVSVAANNKLVRHLIKMKIPKQYKSVEEIKFKKILIKSKIK
jgi:hypothetical protein